MERHRVRGGGRKMERLAERERRGREREGLATVAMERENKRK